MIHIRIDNEELNANQKMACGLTGNLPEGDTYWFDSEFCAAYRADCPGCNPAGPRRLGKATTSGSASRARGGMTDV